MKQRRPPSTAALAALVLALLPLAARAAEAPPVFEGTWIATAGARAFHGRWSAQALPGEPDEMQGSWSMVSDAGAEIMKGTWSAQRARRAFTGKWSARTANGGLFKGSFEAHLPGFKGKTLQDMFAETQTKQISGFWRMGGARGAWYLARARGRASDGDGLPSLRRRPRRPAPGAGSRLTLSPYITGSGKPRPGLAKR